MVLVFLTPFNGLCPHFPKFNVQAFKIFGILWETKWKKMVSDVITFAHKGCKIAASKKVFYRFFVISSLCLNVFLPPLPEVQFPNFLDFGNLWGKVMEINGLRFDNFCSQMV